MVDPVVPKSQSFRMLKNILHCRGKASLQNFVHSICIVGTAAFILDVWTRNFNYMENLATFCKGLQHRKYRHG